LGQHKLKLMAKLEYSRDYTIISMLVLVAPALVLLLLRSLFAFGVLPVVYFYETALQLYSGIALNNWGGKMIAKYTKEGQPFLFYLNVITCFVMGVVSLWITLWVFELVGWIGQK